MSRTPIPCVGFVAPSGTGKTTLLRKLMPELRKRGLRVGYLKHAHHDFDIDQPGKDSYEVRTAGAEQVMIASDQRWACLRETPAGRPSFEALRGHFQAAFEQGQLDLLLVEGFHTERYPKIEVYRAEVGKAPMYPNDPDVVAVATNAPLDGGDYPPVLPVDDPEAIADFIQRGLSDERFRQEDPRDALVRYYRWLRRYGYNDAESGNGSIRVGDRFWITPADGGADELTSDDLIVCPIEGDLPAGASPDAALHQQLYQSQPDARALLHSHGAYSVAVSFGGRDFQPVDFEGRLCFATVPVLAIDHAEHGTEAPAQVAEALTAVPVVILAGHGVYAWGDDLKQAYRWTCSLELSAKIYVLAREAAGL
jgi:L-fuculose-phosphate aldolase